MNASFTQPSWRETPSDIRIARVRVLTEKGLTAGEIAAIFNEGVPEHLHVTRNAIIGIRHRNGIKSLWEQPPAKHAVSLLSPTRLSPEIKVDWRENMRLHYAKKAARNERRNAKKREARAAGRPDKPRPAPVKTMEALAAELPIAGIPMMERAGFTCRAVVDGRDELGLAMMCGASAHSEHSSWCEYHKRLYTRPLPARTGIRPNYGSAARRG